MPRSEEAEAAGAEVRHLAVGRIVGPHGLRGQMRVSIATDDPARFHALATVYLGEEHLPVAVRSVRLTGRLALVQLEGIETREAAEDWRGAWMYVHIDDALPLAEGAYYHHQIVGLTVVTDAGEELGQIVDILVTGANDVYVVRGPAGEILLPAIKQVIMGVSLEPGTMQVHLLDGLR
ncbi:MAG: ribosome maturation factor RimM [Chloroflexota bacterium]